MTYDHDGKVRMDCSSEYAMADVIKQIVIMISLLAMIQTMTVMVSLLQRALPLKCIPYGCCRLFVYDPWLD